MSFSNPAELLLRTMLKQQQHLLQRVQANHTKSRFSSLLELFFPYILHFHVRFYFPFVFLGQKSAQLPHLLPAEK